jgi:hypothetical protein
MGVYGPRDGDTLLDPLVVFNELLAEGITLWRERNVLVYEGPTPLMSDELRALLR